MCEVSGGFDNGGLGCDAWDGSMGWEELGGVGDVGASGLRHIKLIASSVVV